MSITIRTTFRPRSAAKAVDQVPPVPTVPRSGRLMELAIVLDEMVRDGRFESYAAVARLAGVSRARMSQVMDLFSLAPEIQASLLTGELRVGSTDLRGLARLIDWSEQRQQKSVRTCSAISSSSGCV